MKAFAIDRYKSKDGGRIVDLPQPAVGDDDVLVQVHAAGVNLLDAKIADGEFKLFLPYRFPIVLGNDVAGVVVQVGSRVRRFKPGDEVYARPDKDRIGTFRSSFQWAKPTSRSSRRLSLWKKRLPFRWLA
jgi:NADPH:quinone reductase-like Zn-dependent oxidoreductase